MIAGGPGFSPAVTRSPLGFTMAAIDDPQTLGRTRLAFSNPAEIDEFIRILGEYERGEITADQWRTFRLLRGTYGQRQDGVQMLRVKIPQGLLDSRQLRALGDVAERWSRGFGHITTRQNLQFHFIPLADVPAALELLSDAGMTTREACGNSVRNITACPTPASPRTRRSTSRRIGGADTLLPPPPAQLLAPAQVQDRLRGLFRGPRLHRDQRHRLARPGPHQRRTAASSAGFRVTVGGGTATMSRSGQPLVRLRSRSPTC